MIKKYAREIVLIAEYIILLCGVYYWDWSVFTIYLSFVVEYFVLFIFFIALLYFYPAMRDKKLVVGNVLYAGLGLGIVQGAFVLLTGMHIDPEFEYSSEDFPWISAVLFLILPAVLINLFSVLQKPVSQAYIDNQRSRLFVTVLALTVTVGASLLSDSFLGECNLLATLMLVVTGRIIAEIWMHRYQQ
ncbi:MAG: hypothetical protein IPM74_00925 [Crocinitomicaceae bacterium]|nr:hypothetical protein [Crocinitomicaceae bacterium]MBK8924480.1 hypothetical protein [Crocinitomicaceae bacterium]